MKSLLKIVIIIYDFSNSLILASSWETLLISDTMSLYPRTVLTARTWGYQFDVPEICNVLHSSSGASAYSPSLLYSFGARIWIRASSTVLESLWAGITVSPLANKNLTNS